MDSYLSLEESINLSNTVIKSCSDIFLYLNKDAVLNESINNTVSHIFKFLDKLIKTLPEIMISTSKPKHQREPVILSFDQVMVAWSEIISSYNDFFIIWEIFMKEWNKYIETLMKVKDSNSTIYISLN